MTEKHQRSELIDPDPMMMASTAMTAITVILGFVQTYKALRPSAPVMKPGHAPIQRQQLAALEDAVENVEARVRSIARTIERGSDDPERQYFDAPTRVAVTVLLLPAESLDSYASTFAELCTHLGAVARWVTSIQINNPDLAYRLGNRMDQPLAGVADRINEALKHGAPIRTVLTELNATLRSLGQAIEAEMRTGN